MSLNSASGFLSYSSISLINNNSPIKDVMKNIIHNSELAFKCHTNRPTVEEDKTEANCKSDFYLTILHLILMKG